VALCTLQKRRQAAALQEKLEHRDSYAGLFCELDGFVVARVDVARDAYARIVGQHALNAFAHFF
jgi:hypothetical protein